jgi:pimeloyl-ACP methyl ester carboxylesterase
MSDQASTGRLRICLFGGLATSDDIWVPLIKTLPKGVEILHFRILDAQQCLSTDELNVSMVADQFVAQLSLLPSACTHLIGFSLGSWVAQGVCLRMAKPPTTLTLIGSSAHIYRHGLSVVGEWLGALNHINFDAAVNGIYNWMFNSDTYETIPKLNTYFRQGVRLSGVDASRLRKQLEMVRSFTQGFNLSEINTPTLLLRGESDILFPRHASETIAGLIKGSNFIEVPKAGHAALIENPSFCVKKISQHINDSAPRGECIHD